jgi:hypothetical protein
MRRSLVAGLALGLLFGVVSGCTTTRDASDVLAEKASGEAREYKVATDTAWRLVTKTFEQAGFTTVEGKRDQSAVVAKRDVSGESSATLAAGWIDPLKDGTARITVATMRGTGAALRSPASEDALHVRFPGLVGLEAR